MAQEEKQLLLKELCARLPYGVKVKFYLPLNTHFAIETLRDVEIRNEDILICTTTWNAIKLEGCKPYLRPMSSMTEEEKETYEMFFNEDGLLNTSVDTYVDWLLEGLFDFRGLIPKGLASEAPEDMYNTKTTCNNCEYKSYCSQSEYVKNNCYKLK